MVLAGLIRVLKGGSSRVYYGSNRVVLASTHVSNWVLKVSSSRFSTLTGLGVQPPARLTAALRQTIATHTLTAGVVQDPAGST